MTLSEHVNAELVQRLLAAEQTRQEIPRLGEAFVTHYVPAFTLRLDDGSEQAACGEFVSGDLQVKGLEPVTCRRCRMWLSDVIGGPHEG